MRKAKLGDVEVSVIVEGFNYAEGGGLERLRQALDAAVSMQKHKTGREVLLIDTAGQPELTQVLQQFPTVKRVPAIGMKYDQAKTRAAEQAQGEFVLYLDGDCLPAPGWIDAHLAALAGGEAQATGGFTRYEGGFLSHIYTILDFGFLLPRKSRRLGCYASNNSGFRRSALLACPPPTDGLRCNCYAHAQSLQRSGNGVLMVPGAAVCHAVQPFFSERFRQGFDAVGACWVNPALSETRFLRFGVLAAPLFYAISVARDFQRLLAGYRDLDMPAWQLPLAMPLCPIFRIVDFAGMLRALASPRLRQGT
jgi:glycosyltransferase involved in cell wall biosynthesis